MEALPNHYATLGVPATASAGDIKRAYHEAAKRAHPDAGGSPVQMERVNAAYQALSNPADRHDYDRRRAEAAQPPPTPEPTPGSHYASPETAMTPEQHQGLRRRQARGSAWEIVRAGATLSLVMGAVTYLLRATAFGRSATLAVISFLPVYWLLLGITFLINPDLRLHVFDLFSDPRHTNRHEVAAVAGLVLAFFPLLALWVLLYLTFHSLV